MEGLATYIMAVYAVLLTLAAICLVVSIAYIVKQNLK